jgi:hypothetical protein
MKKGVIIRNYYIPLADVIYFEPKDAAKIRFEAIKNGTYRQPPTRTKEQERSRLGRGGGGRDPKGGRGGGGTMSPRMMEAIIALGTTLTPIREEQDMYMTDLDTDTIYNGEETDDENETLAVNQKTKRKTLVEEIYKEFSEELLPKRIPLLVPMTKWEEEREKLTEEDQIDIGIQIRINKRQMKTKKDSKGNTIRYNDTMHRDYQYDRIFGAIAFALLSACPGTAIRGIRESTKDILATEDLTALDFELLDYLEDPVETAREVFFSRIHVKSNRPPFLMKSNKALRDWLIDENIELEVNDLTDIRLTNVGMFIECHPREPLLHVHEYMLRQTLPPQSPEFKMKVWTVQTSEKKNKDIISRDKAKTKKGKKSCKVILIQAAPSAA